MRVVLLYATLLALAGSAGAATITVVNNDAAGEGFNDPAAASPVGGNGGTTLGAQRLNAFTYAATLWGAQLTSAVTIRVDATMDPLTCSAGSATLGSAGTNTVHADFPNAPYSDTWYPQALANKISGSDLSSSINDVVATFNSSIGTTCSFPLTWYYGLDGNPGASELDFVTVVLHEIGHGLGFQTFVTLANGARFNSRDDVFMKFLEDHDLGLTWPNMTNAQRAASAKDDSNLHWTGSAVVSAATFLTGGRHAASGHVQMYAPSMLQGGSSVSHFDTDCAPNELMEPFYTSPLEDPSLARDLMSDIGWDFATSTSTSSTSTTSTSSSSTSSATSTSSSTTVPTTTSTSSSTTSSTSGTSTSSTSTSSSTTATAPSSTSSSSSTSTSTSTPSTSSSSSSSTSTAPTIATTTSSVPATTSSSTISTTSSTIPTTTSTAPLPSTTSTSTSTSTTLTDQGAGLCAPAPMATCRSGASQRSMIKLRRDLTSARNVLKWKIARGGKASPGDFRDPVDGDAALAVCMYDASGSPQPLLSAAFLAGGTCGTKPCWKRLAGDGGYRYRNKAANQDGLTHLKLRLSSDGDLQLLVKGKGGNLPLPPFGLLMPLRMQLLIGDVTGTTCWESSFGSAVRNDAGVFKANGS